MDFEVQVFHHVEEIGAEAWNRLAGDHPFASYRWHQFGETVLANDTPIYIILSQGNTAVARGTFWLTRQEPLPISSNVIRSAMEGVLRRWPLLVCRSPVSWTSGLILPEPPLREAALNCIVREAEKEARQRGASFLLFAHLEKEHIQWAGWPDHFSPATVPGAGTRLDIQWPDFETYLRQHLSRMARKSYRQNSKQAAQLGATIHLHKKVTDPAKAMTLIGNIYRRYGSPLEPWIRPLLEHAPMVDATWLTAELNGEIVACELMLGDGDHHFLTALGIAEDVPYVYFQLLYEDIRYAIDSGVRFLGAGSGAYDVKQRMGFEGIPNNHIAFTGLAPGLPSLARWLAKRAKS